MKLVNKSFYGVFDSRGTVVFFGTLTECEKYITNNATILFKNNCDRVTINHVDWNYKTESIVMLNAVLDYRYIKNDDTVYILNGKAIEK